MHVWQGSEIVGQLELCTVLAEPDTGYIYLIYLTPQARDQGMADLLLQYIGRTLWQAGSRRVSRLNPRALRFYQRCGWQYRGPTPSMPRQISMNTSYLAGYWLYSFQC
jgi:GNAT superfamily N-acetyltransferase